MQRSFPILIVAFVTSCGSSPTTESLPSGGGKADEISVDQCQEQQNGWLIFEFAPLACEDGPACVGKVALDSRPQCDGQPDHATWTLVWDKHIFGPWMLRRNQAHEAFMMADSPDFLDHQKYVQKIAVTAEELAAHQALLSVPRNADLFDVTIWRDRYSTLLHVLAFPLYSQSSTAIGTSDGRMICGDPFLYQEQQCAHEPALYLDASEKQFLSLFEALLPVVEEDGALAEWVDLYLEYLIGGQATADLLHFEFPRLTEKGLAPYELAFFERLRSLAPPAKGEVDSEHWVSWYTVCLSGANLSLTDEVLQLGLYELTRPEQLVGAGAYTRWLGADLLGLGFAADSTDENKLPRLMLAKPCARDQAELQKMQQVFDAFTPDAPTADLKLAAPALCQKGPTSI